MANNNLESKARGAIASVLATQGVIVALFGIAFVWVFGLYLLLYGILDIALAFAVHGSR